MTNSQFKRAYATALFLISAMATHIPNSSAASAPTDADCEKVFLEGPGISVALEGSRTEPDGRITYSYSYINEALQQTQVAELPSAVHALRELQPDFLLVLAGNSGEAYQSTRHNLAQAFGRHLMAETRPITTSAQLHGGSQEAPLFRDTVQITFDDLTTQPWTTHFRTEKPSFRTSSGEIFYFPSLGGRKVVVFQSLGDYNEVGDIAIPLMEKLGLSPDRLILAHDDMTLAQGEIAFRSGQPVSYSGNNATFSFNRNLSYRIIEQVTHAIEAHSLYRPETDRADLAQLRARARSIADVRYANHLGAVPDAFSYAFKNRSAILNALLPYLKEWSKKKLESEAQIIRSSIGTQLSDFQARERAITSTLKGPPSEEAKAKLQALKAEKAQIMAPIKVREQQIEAEMNALKSRIEAIVDSQLSYSQFILGVGRPEDGDMISFVLGPIPQSLLNPSYMRKAREKLEEGLRSPAQFGTNTTSRK